MTPTEAHRATAREEPKAMTDVIEQIKELAAKATPGPWFVAGPPWLASDVETYILSGSPDPHAGEMIVDMPTADMAGVEDKYDETDWSAQNDRNAAYIAACSPDNITTLLAYIGKLEKVVEAVDPYVRRQIRNGGALCSKEELAAYTKSIFDLDQHKREMGNV